MSADDGGIDHHTFLVDFYLERFEDPRPMTAMRPVGETVENRLPRAKTLRQIAPRNACLGPVQNGVDERPVVQFGCRATPFGHGDAHQRPLRIGQSMAEGHAQL